MKSPKTFLTVVIVVAVVALVIGVFAAVAAGRTPAYALKVRAVDKNTSAKVFEGYVLEQVKGKVSIAGDNNVPFRFVARTKAFKKNGRPVSQTSFLSSLVADPVTGDIVSLTGARRSDGTLELDKVVNRSR